MNIIRFLLFGLALTFGCAKHPLATKPQHPKHIPAKTVHWAGQHDFGPPPLPKMVPEYLYRPSSPTATTVCLWWILVRRYLHCPKKTAERLGLALERNYGSVEGLGGASNFHRTTLPTLGLGDARLSGVEFAVGVRGVPEFAYFMPLDGILGNNVWSHFTLEIDYPADTLVLHRPGSVTVPGRWTPMIFDGSHVFAEIGIETRGSKKITDTLIMEVDTGASELLLSGNSGEAFENRYSEGVEPIYGIGASEYMPAVVFYRPHDVFRWVRSC